MVEYGSLSFASFFLCLLSKAWLLENGLARTPPMGWMSWGYYMCSTNCTSSNKCLDEKLILTVADTFYTQGYQEAGYEYIIIDDCWSEKSRSSDGKLVSDKKRFPRGMKYIASYIHKRGLKFGMYLNIAAVTCMSYPGSKYHFQDDINLFASWGVDYVKVDGCFNSKEYLDTAYIKLSKLINETGRPMVLSCSWPYYIEYIHNMTFDYNKILPYCNLWRNYHDVQTSWWAIAAIIDHYEKEYQRLSNFHGPGHWNDPDMLIIGTDSLTEGQTRVHMAVYAMMSSPLLLSCDMTQVTDFEKDILQNMELIAIAQDPLGIMAQPFKFAGSITMWVKRHLPMKGDLYHAFTFAVVNMGRDERPFSFKPVNYGLTSTDLYTILDVFERNYVMNITIDSTVDVIVAPHDVVMYTLFAL